MSLNKKLDNQMIYITNDTSGFHMVYHADHRNDCRCFLTYMYDEIHKMLSGVSVKIGGCPMRRLRFYFVKNCFEPMVK